MCIIVYNRLTRQEQWVPRLDTLIESLLQSRLYDPFALLGLHQEGSGWVIRVYEPYATQVSLLSGLVGAQLKRIHPAGIFEWRGNAEPPAPTVCACTMAA